MRGLVINKIKVTVLLLWIGVVVIGCGKPSTEPVKDKATLRGEGAYMLAVAPGQTRAAIYLTLINSDDQSRSINLVSSNVAGYGEVHNHIHKDGVMSMRKVQHPQIAANTSLSFTPGGYHIMLFDVAEPPLVGDKVELVLAFDQAETIVVPVDVRPVH